MNHINLQELKTRDLSLRELQNVLIELIEQYNKLNNEILRLKSTGQIPSRERNLMDMPYGL